MSRRLDAHCRGAIFTVMALGTVAGCIPVDDFGQLFWVRNESESRVFIRGETWVVWAVDAGDFEQGDFQEPGHSLTILDAGCCELGKVVIPDEDVIIVIRQDQTIEVVEGGPPNERPIMSRSDRFGP